MLLRSLLLLSFGLGFGLRAASTPDLSVQAWHGPAICYSGYRAGQHPDRNRFPSRAQVLEDLRIVERSWSLIRLYGSDRHSEDVLWTIRRHKLRLKVMLGMWISGKPGKAPVNEAQLVRGIALARRYRDIVVAVNVGNEALVSWSDHRMEEPQIVAMVKRVKAAVPCRVTVADDFLYWSQPGNKLVEHLDFITLHTYPLWGRQDIDEAMPTTVKNFEAIQKAYPGKTVVFGEVGWATYTEGDRHVPRAGDETKQKRYIEEVTAWAQSRGVTTFLFEAFDEPWKGTGTEGHWGLFTVDRKAKPVVQERYPDLRPTGPTSPSYKAIPERRP